VQEIAQRRAFRPDEDRVALPTSVDSTRITPSLAAYYRGVQLVNDGHAQAAIPELKLARDGSPEAADFHNALGAAYFEVGNVKAALASLSRAAELSPDDASIAENLATARLVPRSRPRHKKRR
jgi:Flp pilus assembly protein TadD